MSFERETVAVALNPNEATIIPLADAAAEYFRLNVKTGRDADDERILAALALTLGTLITTDGAQRLRDALQPIPDP